MAEIKYKDIPLVDLEIGMHQVRFKRCWQRY